MSEPERLNRSKGLAGALLLSAKTDKAPAGASRRLLAGAALGAALAAKSGAAGSLSASLGGAGSALGHVARWTAWKWVVIGLAGAGSVATVKVALTARDNARAHVSSAAKVDVARPMPAGASPVRAAAAAAPAIAAPAPPVIDPPMVAASVVAAPPPPVPVAPSSVPARAPLPPVAVVAAPPAASPTPTSHLALEIAAIDVAKRTLAAGDAASALAKTDAYDRDFPQGMLAAEANAIRIEALVRVGRRDEARAELARFRASHPGSPLLERLTRAVGD